MVSLRDEHFSRPVAEFPKLYANSAHSFLAPQDALAKGTWCGARDDGGVIILLNGAFENHVRLTKYRKSRGLIVWELLQSSEPMLSWANLDLDQIEPFTLVVYVKMKLFHLAWNGTTKFEKELDTSRPYLWCSSTLYTPEAKEKKWEWLQQWLIAQSDRSFDGFLSFFKTMEDTHNGFLINRNGVMKTVSYTYFSIPSSQEIKVKYMDLGSNVSSFSSLPIVE